MLVSVNVSTRVKLLSSPIDTADPGFQVGEQFEQMAASFGPFVLLVCQFVETASDETIHRGVLHENIATKKFAKTGHLRGRRSDLSPELRSRFCAESRGNQIFSAARDDQFLCGRTQRREGERFSIYAQH